MSAIIIEKAEGLRKSLGDPPWLVAVSTGDFGGEPVIFVYAKGRVPFSVVPDMWRGVKVWVRQVGDISPADVMG